MTPVDTDPLLTLLLERVPAGSSITQHSPTAVTSANFTALFSLVLCVKEQDPFLHNGLLVLHAENSSSLCLGEESRVQFGQLYLVYLLYLECGSGSDLGEGRRLFVSSFLP